MTVVTQRDVKALLKKKRSAVEHMVSEDELTHYQNLTEKFVTEQNLVYQPDGKRLIDTHDPEAESFFPSQNLRNKRIDEWKVHILPVKTTLIAPEPSAIANPSKPIGPTGPASNLRKGKSVIVIDDAEAVGKGGQKEGEIVGGAKGRKKGKGGKPEGGKPEEEEEDEDEQEKDTPLKAGKGRRGSGKGKSGKPEGGKPEEEEEDEDEQEKELGRGGELVARPRKN